MEAEKNERGEEKKKKKCYAMTQKKKFVNKTFSP